MRESAMTEKPKYPPPTEPGWQWYEDVLKHKDVVEIYRDNDYPLYLFADGKYLHGHVVSKMNGIWGPRVPEPKDWP